jgi:hypothetical protein
MCDIYIGVRIENPLNPSNPLHCVSDELAVQSSYQLQPANKFRISSMPNPTGRGGFRKGESGNKLGRPKAVSSLALEVRQHAQLAISVLTKACKTSGVPWNVRVTAAGMLLDRGFGRPAQSIELSTSGPMVQMSMFEGLSFNEQVILQEAFKLVEHQAPVVEEATGEADGLFAEPAIDAASADAP